MHRFIINTLGSLFLVISSTTAYAETSATIVIPDKVKADILKRHPKATDLQASYELHYKRKLLEVSFKEEGSDEEFLELFREDGKIFTRETRLVDLSGSPAIVPATLQETFPGYVLKKVELIVNPNGVGEEYEVYLQASSGVWRVSISDKGVINENSTY